MINSFMLPKWLTKLSLNIAHICKFPDVIFPLLLSHYDNRMFFQLYTVDSSHLATVPAESGVLASDVPLAKCGWVAFSRGGLEQWLRGACCHFASVHLPRFCSQSQQQQLWVLAALCGHVMPLQCWTKPSSCDCNLYDYVWRLQQCSDKNKVISGGWEKRGVGWGWGSKSAECLSKMIHRL